jgi:uncharacterized membrane protein YbhN (UPF0104 family)
MANRAVRVGVSLVLMIVLLALFLKGVDFAKVGQVLATADGPLLAAAVLVALFSYVLRALRWKFILLPVGRVRFSSVLITTAVGYAALSLLPARMGDLIRPILLARREKIPASASLASILTERVFDLWTVVFFFLIFIVWPPPMPNLDEGARHYLELLSLSGYVVGGGLVVGTLILLGLFRYQDRMVEVLTRPVGWIKESWKQPFPLRAAYLIVTMAVIGLAVPTPGGVGGFHKATQVGMTMFFGIGLNKATGIAIAYHAICFIPITIIGLLCLPLLGVKLREVEAMSAEGAEE